MLCQPSLPVLLFQLVRFVVAHKSCFMRVSNDWAVMQHGREISSVVGIRMAVKKQLWPISETKVELASRGKQPMTL